MNINVNLAADQTFDIATGGELDYYGAIFGSSYGITQTGNGRLALLNNYIDNTYGTTTVLGGKLLLASAIWSYPAT